MRRGRTRRVYSLRSSSASRSQSSKPPRSASMIRPASRAFTVGPALTVTITEPGDGAAVPAGPIVIRGTVQAGGVEVTVTVNGVPAAVVGTTFLALAGHRCIGHDREGDRPDDSRPASEPFDHRVGRRNSDARGHRAAAICSNSSLRWRHDASRPLWSLVSGAPRPPVPADLPRRRQRVRTKIGALTSLPRKPTDHAEFPGVPSQPRKKPDQAADSTEGCPDPRTKRPSMTDCHGFLHLERGESWYWRYLPFRFGRGGRHCKTSRPVAAHN